MSSILSIRIKVVDDLASPLHMAYLDPSRAIVVLNLQAGGESHQDGVGLRDTVDRLAPAR